MSINVCSFLGRLTADIELRYTQSGKAVTEFTIAVDDGFGQSKKSHFLRFVAWEKTAEALSKYAAKGKRLAIAAKAIQDSWTDKDSGKKQSKTQFLVLNVDIIDFRSDEDGNSGGVQQNYPNQNTEPRQPQENHRYSESDIPDNHQQQKANGYQPQPEVEEIPF